MAAHGWRTELGVYQISWLAQGLVTKPIVLWSGQLGVAGYYDGRCRLHDL